jgi:4-amino-4-deoxy-L-arabinose transferase-like glycosyltransferase
MTDAKIPSDSGSERRSFFAEGMLIVLVIALGKLVLHCVFNNSYGYFRDEFDYMSCGDHLAWGYVDQPPLLPFLVRVSRLVLGDSLRSIRFLPALVTSAAWVLTALIAREFGGRRFPLILSAVVFLIAPSYLSGGSLLTTNCIEPLLWMGCAYFAILAIKRSPRYWLLFGVVAGLGLEEKYSIAVFGFGIVVGLLLTKQRSALLTSWFWLGGAAAFLIFLPNILWNMHHDWPFLQLMHNIRTDGRDVQLSPIQFFAQQILLVHPLSAPIWLTGLVALLLSRRLKNYRLFGWCYLVAFTLFVALKGKNYYLVPIYPVLFAAGAVIIEVAIERTRRVWLQPVVVLLLLAGGAWFAPLVVPVFSVDHFIAYMDMLPFKVPRLSTSRAARTAYVPTSSAGR